MVRRAGLAVVVDAVQRHAERTCAAAAAQRDLERDLLVLPDRVLLDEVALAGARRVEVRALGREVRREEPQTSARPVPLVHTVQLSPVRAQPANTPLSMPAISSASADTK
jgi:hypothetical protein